MYPLTLWNLVCGIATREGINHWFEAENTRDLLTVFFFFTSWLIQSVLSPPQMPQNVFNRFFCYLMLFYFTQTQVVLGCAWVNLCNRSSEVCVWVCVFPAIRLGRLHLEARGFCGSGSGAENGVHCGVNFIEPVSSSVTPHSINP